MMGRIARWPADLIELILVIGVNLELTLTFHSQLSFFNYLFERHKTITVYILGMFLNMVLKGPPVEIQF